MTLPPSSRSIRSMPVSESLPVPGPAAAPSAGPGSSGKSSSGGAWRSCRLAGPAWPGPGRAGRRLLALRTAPAWPAGAWRGSAGSAGRSGGTGRSTGPGWPGCGPDLHGQAEHGLQHAGKVLVAAAAGKALCLAFPGEPQGQHAVAERVHRGVAEQQPCDLPLALDRLEHLRPADADRFCGWPRRGRRLAAGLAARARPACGLVSAGRPARAWRWQRPGRPRPCWLLAAGAAVRVVGLLGGGGPPGAAGSGLPLGRRRGCPGIRRRMLIVTSGSRPGPGCELVLNCLQPRHHRPLAASRRPAAVPERT